MGFKDLTPQGQNFIKVAVFVLIAGVLVGGFYGYNILFPKKAKITNVTTKATGLPPLAYDKTSNAPFRKLPNFNEPADVQSPEIRGFEMGWSALDGVHEAVGGTSTAVGSICEELGLNIHLSVQNSCTEQGNQLYAFAQAYHKAVEAGDAHAQPTEGCHFINWMADANAAYFSGLNARLAKDFGDEYRAEVITFTGASFGEDKWMLKPKFAKDPRGSVTATVVGDGDYNIMETKCQLIGVQVNHDLGTWDATKVNLVDAPNGDYVESGKMYISGAKVKLHIVENGKLTNRDTLIAISGVSSWFPVDQQVVEQKGGLITFASTKDFGGQMACGLIFIKAWADANPELVDKLIEAFGRGGDQVKAHDEALQFACQVSEVVFADKEKDAQAWYKGYKSFPLTDEDGNTVEIGGSRVFNIADAANYVGLTGGSDKYKKVYNTFGNIVKEAFPERVASFPDYETVTDWSFLKRVYTKTKGAGTAGTISKTDFSTAQKGALIGDASYSNIQFSSGKADIKPSSYAELNKLVAELNISDNSFVEIGGHTDNVGNPENNQNLSEERAEAVKQYLISQDADLAAPNRIKTKGYGQSSPLNPADVNSPAARAANRRVQIKFFRAK